MTLTPDKLRLRLSEASGVPFYRQILEQLSDLIRSGSLVGGASLPSVRELAAQLRVSVITTRRAYRELESVGLVEARQGSGTFVADDIVAASARRARQAAREALAAAVERGRRLGLSDGEQRALFEELISNKETEA